MKVLLSIMCVVVMAGEGMAGYHEEVGIPLAARIKEAEDELFAIGPNVKSGKITGGVVSPDDAHPYMAGIIIYNQNERKSFCGASLVSPNRLITAAHCSIPLATYEVVLGSQYLFYGGTRINTTEIAVYPGYNSHAHGNDIAVIYLPVNVTFTKYIQPIYLPVSEEDYIGEFALAVGYGRGGDDVLKYFPRMRQVYLEVMPENTCKSLLSRYVVYPTLGTTVCTVGRYGQSVCDGDSGGPLIVTKKGRKILIGVISLRFYSCEDGYPSIFTRITSYSKFITTHIRGRSENDTVYVTV